MLPERFRLVSGRRVTVLAACVVALIAVFQWRNAEMMCFAGGMDASPLDGRWQGYSLDEAAALFEALGADGRAFYDLSELSLDLLFSLVYGGLLAILVWLLWRQPWRSLLVGVVTIGVLADLTENGLIAYLYLTYNGKIQPLSHAANVATLVQSGFLAVAVVGVGIGILLKYVVRQRSN